MARYTAEQIYAFAREAGFSPDRAATMTAVALAESRGNSTAHNPVGENSQGLWQINRMAHAQFASMDLYDPVQNAKAAFLVSHGGDDISPWTTTHGGGSARYIRYRADAEAAAAAYGDGPHRGMWSGSGGYGDHTSAGDGRGGGQGIHQTSTAPASTTAGSDNINISQAAVSTDAQAQPAVSSELTRGEELGIPLDEVPAGPSGVQSVTGGAGGSQSEFHRGEELGIPLDGDSNAPVQQPAATPTAQATALQMGGGDATKLQKFLDSAVAQSGDRYIFGVETNLDNPNPSAFDCSELVEWATHQAGVKMPDGAWNQYRHLADEHATMSVEQAIHTPGALLFSFDRDPMTGKPGAAHVAISLGNGKTIEAKGTQYGVGSWEATGKRFQYAGFMPEMMAGPGGAPFVPTPPPPAAAQADAFTHRVNHDPAPMDHHPATVHASHQMTVAEPPPALPPPPPPPEPVVQDMHTLAVQGDADGNGIVDSMEHHSDWVAPEDHSLHPPVDPVHDDPTHHDPVTGH
jgi:cell wall-associated NlpC family hydrolase